MSVSLATLYARAESGKVLEWQIETDGNKYRTITGQQDGKKVTSEWTICVGKNFGRANATTPEQQATAEALSQWKKKLKSGGYWERVEDIDQCRFIEPMLAAKYKDHRDSVVFPVMVDRKYNGMRQITSAAGAFTRTGEAIKTAPHIVDELQPLFKLFPNLVLDGELYNHEYRYRLNELISIVRKTKSFTTEDLVKSKAIVRYYVYDGYGFMVNGEMITEQTPCETRREALCALLNACPSALVVPYYTASSHQDIDTLYKMYIEDGYEGAIIRSNTAYEHRRTKALLKAKPEEDAEFQILALNEGEGNWAGAAKTATVEVLQDMFDGDGTPMIKAGGTFDATFKGSKENAARILANPQSWVGKIVTVQYFGFTGLGKPNFAQIDPANCFKGDR